MYPELTSLAVAPNGDLWIAGSGGVVRRWDGACWTVERIDVSVVLDALWAAGDDDVWVGGHRGTGPRHPGLLRRRGGAWTPYEAPEVRAIWGASEAEAWATGWGAAELLAWDGERWSRWAGVEARLRRVFGLARHDVWAAGEDADGGCVLHWDGRRWQRVASDPTARFGDVASTRVGEAWAVDRSQGRLARVTEEGWAFESAPFDVCSVGHVPGALCVAGALEVAFLEDGRWRCEALSTEDAVTIEVGADGQASSVGPCFLDGVAASHGDLWAIGNAIVHGMESTAEGFRGALFRRRAETGWEPVALPR